MTRYLRSVVLLYLPLSAFVSPVMAERNPPGKIAWFGTLDDGLQIAAQTNRPILLISGAPHCHGVPGTW